MSYAYVANRSGDSISVIDLENNKVEHIELDPGSWPVATAFSSDNKKVYVTNSGRNNVTVVDADTRTRLKNIDVGKNPGNLVVVKEKVFVVNQGGDPQGELSTGTISIIDTKTQVVTDMQVGKIPWGIAVSPDQQTLYVTNNGSKNISVFRIDDKGDLTEQPDIDLKSYSPSDICVTAQKIYVTCQKAGVILVLNLQGNIIKEIMPGVTNGVHDYLLDPIGIACVDEHVYVTNYCEGLLTIIDSHADTILGNVKVGKWPIGIAVKKVNGSSPIQVYVTSQGTDKVYIVDIHRNLGHFVRTFKVGNSPWGISIGGTGAKTPSKVIADESTKANDDDAINSRIVGMAMVEEEEPVEVVILPETVSVSNNENIDYDLESLVTRASNNSESTVSPYYRSRDKMLQDYSDL